MKLVAIYLFLSILLLACQPQQDQYYWQQLKLVGGMEKNILSIRYDKKKSPNGYSVLYKSPLGKHTYLKDTVNNLLIRSYEETTVQADTLRHVESKTFYIQGKFYKIEHFKSDGGGGIDSGTEFYWNDELGLVLYRGTHWPIYFILQSGDRYQNQKIWALVKAVYPGIKNYIYLKGMLNSELKPGFEHVVDDSYQTY